MKATLIRDDLRVRNPQFNGVEQQARAAKAHEHLRRARELANHIRRERRQPTPAEVDEMVRLYDAAERIAYTVPQYVPAERGHVIHHWDAHKLVRQGVAVPNDKDCARRVGMSDDALEKVQKSYERAARGIDPDDWGAYERGEMDGYNEHGHPTLNGKPVQLEYEDDDE